MKPSVVVLGGLILVATGCYQTVYQHLEPAVATTVAQTKQPRFDDDSGWQHFFLYGWVPSERVIPASETCGGPEEVEAIQTGQTFVQGVIATFAGYYVNIYSPYTGKVVCTGTIHRE
jgi:hypothetical protein